MDSSESFTLLSYFIIMSTTLWNVCRVLSLIFRSILGVVVFVSLIGMTEFFYIFLVNVCYLIYYVGIIYLFYKIFWFLMYTYILSLELLKKIK